MIINNLTFMIEPARSEALVCWLSEICVRLDGEETVAGTRLQKVIEVPGEPDYAEQAVSIALQIDFRSRSDQRLWSVGPLEEMMEDYRRKFGPDSIMFMTVLETI